MKNPRESFIEELFALVGKIVVGTIVVFLFSLLVTAALAYVGWLPGSRCE